MAISTGFQPDNACTKKVPPAEQSCQEAFLAFSSDSTTSTEKMAVELTIPNGKAYVMTPTHLLIGVTIYSVGFCGCLSIMTACAVFIDPVGDWLYRTRYVGFVAAGLLAPISWCMSRFCSPKCHILMFVPMMLITGYTQSVLCIVENSYTFFVADVVLLITSIQVFTISVYYSVFLAEPSPFLFLRGIAILCFFIPADFALVVLAIPTMRQLPNIAITAGLIVVQVAIFIIQIRKFLWYDNGTSTQNGAQNPTPISAV